MEVTCRTLQGRYLLKPGPDLREIVIGVLARAQQRYGPRIHAFVFLSNHFHLLLSVDDARQMADFMGFVNSNIAREAGRRVAWREKFWGRRYRAILVSDEEAIQVDRLRYLLAHGCKEGLVGHPAQWPGANSVQALLDGAPLEGTWFDRTREYSARRGGKSVDERRFAETLSLTLAPLPCWAQLPEALIRQLVAEIVAGIVEETAERHRRLGTRPLGLAHIRRQSPEERPRQRKKTSPAPRFHCASKAAREALRAAYSHFLAAFRQAVDRMRAGRDPFGFPEGCFPPAMPFSARAGPLRI